MVKEEKDGQGIPLGGKGPQVEDHLYMKVGFVWFCLPLFVV